MRLNKSKMTKKERYKVYRKLAKGCYDTDYNEECIFLCNELSRFSGYSFEEFKLFIPNDWTIGVWFRSSEFEDPNLTRGFVMDLCAEMCK